jgi:hypothetical protein
VNLLFHQLSYIHGSVRKCDTFYDGLNDIHESGMFSVYRYAMEIGKETWGCLELRDRL